jgi:5''-3'' exonuclease (including N-terminal domain of PolI)
MGELSGSTAAIDAPNWLYKYMTTTAQFTSTSAYTSTDGTELPNVLGTIQGAKKFYKYNIQPVFVFDGKPDEMKAEEIEERREKRKKAERQAEKATTASEKARYESRAQQLNEAIINTTQTVLDHLNIPHVTAPKAAEAQTAYMSRTPTVDYALSDDYDSLLFGASRTLRDFTSSGNTAEVMQLAKATDKHGITRKNLIHAAILCGTDYNDGVSGIGPKTSLKIITEHNDIEQVLDQVDSPVPRAEQIEALFYNPPHIDTDVEPELGVPDTQALESFAHSNGLDLSPVRSAIETLDQDGSQTGLGQFDG